MSTIFIERTVNLNGPIIPDTLTGVLNCGEVDSHEFTISATLDNELFALSGVVTASFIRSDGVTVPLTGSISDGAAVVVLSDLCYNVPGRFAFTVFITSEGVTTAIYGCTGTVRQTDSGSIVDPGEIIPSVSGLITAIENAIAEIPADYSQLLATQAQTFSPSTPYVVGSYVWYDGTLYRFTAAHAAGSWTGSDATAVTIGGELADLKSASSDFDKYGALSLQDFVNGTYYPGAFTLVYSGNNVDITGTPTGSGYTHSNLYNSASAFPDGLSAGQTIQLAQNCDDANVRFRFCEYINDAENWVVDIAGTGVVQHTISEDATGCIIRYSFANGHTYNHVKSTYYIFTTLTKQQVQEDIDSLKSYVETTVTNKIEDIQNLMPTAGDKQLINPDTVSVEKIRVGQTGSHGIIAANDYQTLIVPVVVEIGSKYYAIYLGDSATFTEFRLASFNTLNIGDTCVNYSDSYSAGRSRLTATSQANYLVLCMKISTGTFDEVFNNIVLAKATTYPTEYTPYYVSVDEAIDNALGKKTSPDCVEVGVSSSDYSYTDINTAVSENAGSIIKINYGTYETEVEDLTTDKTLIGTDPNLCILEKHNGEYAKPPIEIAGGIIKNLTVKMVNNTEATQFGYCVHSDNSNTANKTLLIKNCIFDNDLYRVIGMGVRGGETVIFEDCIFIGHGTTTGQSIYIHNSSGTKATVKFRNCYFQAVNECLLLQGWGSDCNVDWEFIDCTCYSENYGVGVETVWTDYASGSTHDQNRLHEFSGKFTLLPTSHGNNISVLNYTT